MIVINRKTNAFVKYEWSESMNTVSKISLFLRKLEQQCSCRHCTEHNLIILLFVFIVL